MAQSAEGEGRCARPASLTGSEGIEPDTAHGDAALGKSGTAGRGQALPWGNGVEPAEGEGWELVLPGDPGGRQPDLVFK